MSLEMKSYNQRNDEQHKPDNCRQQYHSLVLEQIERCAVCQGKTAVDEQRLNPATKAERKHDANQNEKGSSPEQRKQDCRCDDYNGTENGNRLPYRGQTVDETALTCHYQLVRRND